MNISISLSLTPSAMPQIMFAGDLDRHAALVAGMGYRGLDLFIPQPAGVDIRTVKSVLDRNGLAVTMLAAAGDIMADGLFLNEADPARLQTLLERSRRHLDMAANLGAMPNIGFLRGRHPEGADSAGRADSLKRMADGLRRYCELAATLGVDVLLEPICRYEINSINTVAQALDLHRMAGAPANLWLLPDIFHMNMEEASVCGAFVTGGKLVRHVHFVDNTRGVPGSGCLPLGDVVACLAALGYGGFLGIEAMPGPDPEGEARLGLAVTNALCAFHKGAK